MVTEAWKEGTGSLCWLRATERRAGSDRGGPGRFTGGAQAAEVQGERALRKVTVGRTVTQVPFPPWTVRRGAVFWSPSCEPFSFLANSRLTTATQWGRWGPRCGGGEGEPV